MANNWTREQLIVALNVYCKIPFKNSSARHPMVQEYAKIIGRTPAALNLKIGNLGSFDPVLREKGIVGLAHTSKMDEQIWNEFFENPEKLAYESSTKSIKIKKFLFYFVLCSICTTFANIKNQYLMRRILGILHKCLIMRELLPPPHFVM